MASNTEEKTKINSTSQNTTAATQATDPNPTHEPPKTSQKTATQMLNESQGNNLSNSHNSQQAQA